MPDLKVLERATHFALLFDAQMGAISQIGGAA